MSTIFVPVIQLILGGVRGVFTPAVRWDWIRAGSIRTGHPLTSMPAGGRAIKTTGTSLASARQLSHR